MSDAVVIIGAGQAGIQAATSLRSGGYEGRVVIIADESALPYQKPPLSKGFLMGVQHEDNLHFKADHYYEKKDIELMLGDGVDSIDTANKNVRLSSGDQVEYTSLIIATGTRNRILNIPGSELEGAYYLRSLEDGIALKNKLGSAKKIAVIGGGFIGLEIAAAARYEGIEVSVIEVCDRLMARVLPPVVSDLFEQTHRANDVDFHFNSKAVSFANDGQEITGVVLDNGRTINADFVVVGIGVIPNQEIAKEAGISCSNGIEVNEFTETSIPGIYAIGDCALHHNPFMGRQARLESVQNAMDQAKTAVAAILGQKEKYYSVPWFWTHQYELKLQMAGCNEGFSDYVVRGNMEEHKYSVYYYKEDALIGVDSINRASDHLSARKLLQAGVSPTREQAADEDFKLKQLIVK